LIITNVEVVKRDNRSKNYKRERIENAVDSARDDAGVEDETLGVRIADLIEDYLEEYEIKEISVEDIQDLVIEFLKQENEEVAKAYQEYRINRTRERESNSKLLNDITEIFEQTSEEIRNNANKAGDKLQTYRAMIADVACNNYADTKIIPKRLLDKHGKSIYIHDKSYFPIPIFNCILVNWMDMLDNGFKMVAKIEQPKSLQTAIALLSQIVAHTSSSTYGGNTLADLDMGLEKYAIKSYNKHLDVAKKWIKGEEKQKEYAWDRLTKECMDAMQSLEYEIATLMNSRGEQPFLTVTIGYGRGRYCRLIQECLLKTRIKGYSDGTTPVFPKICFFAEDGLNRNPEDPNYDLFQLAVKCSSIRQYPDYINVEQLIKVTGDRKSPMSCRSYLGSYKDENGNFVTNGRFNQGVCSINLVRLGILANHDENKFFELLQEALEDAKEVLMIRHNMLRTVKAKQAPILYMEGAVARLNPEDSIEPLLYGGFSSISIGYIGIHNTLMALYGKGLDSYSSEIIQKGKDIMQYMRDFCDNQKKETNIGFSLYSTPFEIGATKLCTQDVKDFGIIEGVNDKTYYENSFHFPSDTEVTAVDKINIESNFMHIASGGAIEYTEYGNMIHNTEALEDIIRFSKDKLHYVGVNTRADHCLKCGFKGLMTPQTEGENDYVCPQCGNTDKNKMSIVIRLCGYLGSLSERPTIDGKMKEMQNRYIHVGEMNYELPENN
jgi:ribonucleoside-triphosphate reductase